MDRCIQRGSIIVLRLGPASPAWQLEQDSSANHWFFISPSAGGHKVTCENYEVTFVTKQSPMAQALLGKMVDDEVSLPLGAFTITDSIVEIL